MAAKSNEADFLDRVYHARKDGTVLAFDESEVLIRYDDGSESWVRKEKVRLTKRAADWVYLPDGSTLPFAKGLI